MKRIIAFASLLAISSSPALSDVSSELAAIEVRLKTCIDKDSSDAAMKMCSNQAGKEADKLLNKVYQAALKSFKGSHAGQPPSSDSRESSKRLMASERAWVAYRNADCSLQGVTMLGGTGESLVISDCFYLLTKNRVKDLDDLFHDSATDKK
jgi:uncharacterized protein YecT (DUF1311 family)